MLEVWSKLLSHESSHILGRVLLRNLKDYSVKLIVIGNADPGSNLSLLQRVPLPCKSVFPVRASSHIAAIKTGISLSDIKSDKVK
jgi:hypothetical protein